ncbi:MAG: type III-A CRISPR-associated protein Csm2 [Methanobacteriota archaeon]|nr:MAG: type III-A CRISPR-associated protein Csm2 [Euryarchaeota archaeon]
MGDLQDELRKKILKEEEKHDQPKEERKMIQFYKDGALDPDLVQDQALKWARSFLKDKKPLTMSQLRKFYGEVLDIEAKKKAGADFKHLLPLIKMMKSKAAYAYSNGGSNQKIPRSFKEFIDIMIDSVNEPKDFDAFKLVFEAVVGYSVGEGVR